MKRTLASRDVVGVEQGDASGIVRLTVERYAGANATGTLNRREAEDTACALLQAAGWDTTALLAGPQGRAPVFVGELKMRREPREIEE